MNVFPNCLSQSSSSPLNISHRLTGDTLSQQYEHHLLINTLIKNNNFNGYESVPLRMDGSDAMLESEWLHGYSDVMNTKTFSQICPYFICPMKHIILTHIYMSLITSRMWMYPSNGNFHSHFLTTLWITLHRSKTFQIWLIFVSSSAPQHLLW